MASRYIQLHCCAGVMPPTASRPEPIQLQRGSFRRNAPELQKVEYSTWRGKEWMRGVMRFLQQPAINCEA